MVLFLHYSLISKIFVVVVIVVGILCINICLPNKTLLSSWSHCICNFSIVSIMEFVYCYFLVLHKIHNFSIFWASFFFIYLLLFKMWNIQITHVHNYVNIIYVIKEGSLPYWLLFFFSCLNIYWHVIYENELMKFKWNFFWTTTKISKHQSFVYPC